MARVYWYMSIPDLERYLTLGQQVAMAQMNGDALKVEELLDQIQQIPGLPSYNPDHDTVVPMPIVERRKVIVEVRQ